MKLIFRKCVLNVIDVLNVKYMVKHKNRNLPVAYGLHQVMPGDTLELQTLNGGLEEINSRYFQQTPQPPGLMIIPACTAATLTDPQYAKDAALPRKGNEEIQTFLAQVATSSCIMVPIWSDNPAHFTFLQATRPLTTAPWQLTYADSLPQASYNGYMAADRVARNLGLLSPGEQLPGVTQPDTQKDGWSCGLWVLHWMECSIKKMLHPDAIAQRMDMVDHALTCGQYKKTGVDW